MKAYGVDGKVANWVKDFLVGRKMKVTVRESASDWCDVLSGVPQGSVLGPLLFLIYVNDLPEKVNCEAKIFADDTKLFKVVTNITQCQELQQDLTKIYEWTNV